MLMRELTSGKEASSTAMASWLSPLYLMSSSKQKSDEVVAGAPWRLGLFFIGGPQTPTELRKSYAAKKQPN